MVFKNASEKSSALLDNPSPSLSITLCIERKKGLFLPLGLHLDYNMRKDFAHAWTKIVRKPHPIDVFLVS